MAVRTAPRVAEPAAGGQGVTVVEVAAEDEGSRLDRWFRRHFPHLSHGRVEKLLRTGQVRLDGKRVKANARLAAGAKIRLPPMPAPSPERAEALAPRPAPKFGKEEIEALRALVIHKDADVLAINKPPGLAVQGGTGMTKHLDAMLDALKFDSPERPRLVHRLDKDTSGVLLLARNRAAAAKLGESLRGREARKLYWAVVVGVPKPKKGRIDLPLSKLPHPKGERIAPDEEEGKRAETLYAVIETLGNKAAWLALMPLTGRTHQLRVHCAALGTPILGDGKYGGQGAYLTGEGLSRKLHLHAREILVPHPKGGKLKVTAELPEHMRKTWKLLGFDEKSAADPFAEAGW